MSRPQQLANPPIREAIIEFVFDSSLSEEDVKELAANFVADRDNWTKKDSRLITAKLQFGTEQAFERSESFHGIRISSPDSTSIVIFRPDRVTVSRVNSYTSWEELEASAFEVVSRYVERSISTSLRRISTRFINIIKPSADGPFAALKQVPRALVNDAELTDFVDRQVLLDRHGHRVNVILGTSLEPGSMSEGNNKGIVLDIDVVKEGHMNLQDAHAILCALRETKNDVFFGTLRTEAFQ